MKKSLFLLCFIGLFGVGCTPTSSPDLLSKQNFDTTIQNKKVELYTIQNKTIAVQLTNFGARIVALFVPDNQGAYRDVVWGYSSIKDYLNATDQYSGPIVGRYGNRIGKGQFTLDGVEYQTTINNGPNHLHGGVNGWSTKVWDAQQLSDSMVVMSYVSSDREEGYPGTVLIKVTYTATAQRGLTINYEAITDRPTVLNPTSHTYFNLSGRSCDVLEHVLVIAADRFTPTDSTLIPTGAICPVEGSPMDFRTPTTIGARINANYQPLTFGQGYDHNWIFTVVDPAMAQAVLISPETGIKMELYTDQPAVQFYSGNFMDGVDTGKRGDKHNHRSGVALEAQNYPDAPNHSAFPSSVLRPGETYRQTTQYLFSTKPVDSE